MTPDTNGSEEVDWNDNTDTVRSWALRIFIIGFGIAAVAGFIAGRP